MITGPRQVGKTTMLEKLMTEENRGREYVTLDERCTGEFYYRDRDTKEIDIIIEGDGKLYPIEIKKTATPASQLTRVFGVIDKSPLIRGVGAVLCTSDKLSAFDKDNLIVPIWLV